MNPGYIAVIAVFGVFLAVVGWMVVVGRFTMIAAQIHDWVTADIDDQRDIGRHRASGQHRAEDRPDDGPSNGVRRWQ